MLLLEFSMEWPLPKMTEIARYSMVHTRRLMKIITTGLLLLYNFPSTRSVSMVGQPEAK